MHDDFRFSRGHSFRRDHSVSLGIHNLEARQAPCRVTAHCPEREITWIFPEAWDFVAMTCEDFQKDGMPLNCQRSTLLSIRLPVAGSLH